MIGTRRRVGVPIRVEKSSAASEVEGRMGLEMRMRCERCDGPLTVGGAAFICSYECTFFSGVYCGDRPGVSEL